MAGEWTPQQRLNLMPEPHGQRALRGVDWEAGDGTGCGFAAREFLLYARTVAHELEEYVGAGGVTIEGAAQQDVIARFLDEDGGFGIRPLGGNGRDEE